MEKYTPAHALKYGTAAAAAYAIGILVFIVNLAGTGLGPAVISLVAFVFLGLLMSFLKEALTELSAIATRLELRERERSGRG